MVNTDIFGRELEKGYRDKRRINLVAGTTGSDTVNSALTLLFRLCYLSYLNPFLCANEDNR